MVLLFTCICTFCESAAIIPVFGLSPDDDIDTNRPTFTDSALVVPRGSLQLENGTLYQPFQRGKFTYDIPETEVRLGLTKSTEFQMFTPNFVLQHTPGLTVAGTSDLNEIGIKHQLKSISSKLAVSVIAGVNAPTGRQFISGSGAQPVFRAPWSYALTKKWSVCGMQSFLLLNSGRDPQWQPAAFICRTLGTRTIPFLEYAGFFTRGQLPVNIIHLGAVHKISKNQQIDFHFGFGTNQATPVAIIGAGYSIRFDKLY